MRVEFLVVRRVRNFQVLDCEAGDIIHGDLKVHRNGPDLLSALGCRGLAQGDLGDECVLVPSLELLDRPLSHLLLLLILKGLTLDSLGQLKRDSS